MAFKALDPTLNADLGQQIAEINRMLQELYASSGVSGPSGPVGATGPSGPSGPSGPAGGG